jgi:hypothetical protein
LIDQVGLTFGKGKAKVGDNFIRHKTPLGLTLTQITDAASKMMYQKMDTRGIVMYMLIIKTLLTTLTHCRVVSIEFLVPYNGVRSFRIELAEVTMEFALRKVSKTAIMQLPYVV